MNIATVTSSSSSSSLLCRPDLKPKPETSTFRDIQGKCGFEKSTNGAFSSGSDLSMIGCACPKVLTLENSEWDQKVTQKVFTEVTEQEIQSCFPIDFNIRIYIYICIHVCVCVFEPQESPPAGNGKDCRSKALLLSSFIYSLCTLHSQASVVLCCRQLETQADPRRLT